MAIIDFFGISDSMSRGENWNRSSDRVGSLNGLLAEAIKSINPNIITKVDETVDYGHGFRKNHDITIRYNGNDTIRKVAESKFINSEYNKNDNNFFQDEKGLKDIVEGVNVEHYSLLFVRSSAIKLKRKDKFESIKERSEKYEYYIGNVCIYYYDDETKEYKHAGGLTFDDFLNKIASEIVEVNE